MEDFDQDLIRELESILREQRQLGVSQCAPDIHAQINSMTEDVSTSALTEECSVNDKVFGNEVIEESPAISKVDHAATSIFKDKALLVSLG